MDATFERAQLAAQAIEGMISDFSMALMDCMLACQQRAGVGGHIVEFGVYKGKSAAILANRSRDQERLVLVDINSQIDAAKISALFPTFEFVEWPSEHFREKVNDYDGLQRNCRFIHVDSSHGYRTTLHELALCESLAASQSIIVLDDFTNLDYSQILAAVYKYLYTIKTNLCVFLVTADKAYLCPKADFEHYADYVLKDLLADMGNRGLGDLCIARTDWDPEYRAFSLRRRAPGDSGQFYGENLYGQFYKCPNMEPQTPAAPAERTPRSFAQRIGMAANAIFSRRKI